MGEWVNERMSLGMVECIDGRMGKWLCMNGLTGESIDKLAECTGEWIGISWEEYSGAGASESISAYK